MPLLSLDALDRRTQAADADGGVRSKDAMTDARLLSGTREWARLATHVVSTSRTNRRPADQAEAGALPGRRQRRGGVLCHDLGAASRWPEFAPRCTSLTSVRSILSVPIPLQQTIVRRSAPIPPRPCARRPGRRRRLGVSSVCGDGGQHPAARTRDCPVQHRAGQQPPDRHRRRHPDGALRVTSQQAFDLVTRASQCANRKVRDIAAEVELPVLRRPRPPSAGLERN